MTTRRTFAGHLVGAGLGLALGPRASARAEAAPGAAGPGLACVPAGELAARVALTASRLTKGGLPEFSRDFVLADVAQDSRRRFAEYSGDLSGRYLEALCVLPAGDGLDLDWLAGQIRRHQHPDGRFGNPQLRYTATEIGGLHMAQLWGNGRLLLGLTQHGLSTGNAESLAAARRLAAFLAGVRDEAARPEVAERMRGQGAMGIICFTQLVEPLVLLASATGEGRYLEEARTIVPSLGPRGIQHAHGYLTTLRGMVALARATKDTALRTDVERRYADLVASPDLCPLGGVLEYFGWDDRSFSDEDRRAFMGASGSRPRDEGCAIADFLRLSLDLFRATGRAGYLERAERCLLNHFSLNQFATGDFGHRAFFEQGVMPTPSVGRAWWCCTMHGYRAFRDVLDAVVRLDGDRACVDLFQDVDWAREGLALGLRYRAESPLRSRLTIQVHRTRKDAPLLALRKPEWAESVTLSLNGAAVSAPEAQGYHEIGQRLLAGDQVEMAMTHRAFIETRDGRRLAPAEVGGEIEGILAAGPWLYAADDELEPLFFGEPWQGANVVSLPSELQVPPSWPPERPFQDPRRHLAAHYRHGGFPGEHPLVLRPIAEQTGRAPGTVATWMLYRSET